ncbi:hypothetical protein [Polyangium aurulentum]|uniref:hypothetical protein n=1 Tax=Polyangium aurulentum TaxID=2567896 RepID=UPI0010AE9F46|nr:hypothetical protein [Polyangium aurulentum]UQA55814.1 hypothetical protein E8A73_031350 [Polyangium aurulentum]
MSDGRMSLTAAVLAAAGMLVATVGAGVLVGRSTLGRRSPAANDWAPAAPDRALGRELAACRRKLAARSKAPPTPSAVADAPEEALREAPETATQIEALEEELNECKQSERLTNADTCSSSSLYKYMSMALPYTAEGCEQKAEIAERIERNREKCDEFKDPPDLDWENLTEDDKRILHAYNASISRSHDDVKFARVIVQVCLQKTGQIHE